MVPPNSNLTPAGVDGEQEWEMLITGDEFGWGEATLKCSFGKVVRIFSLILPSPLSALLPSTGNNISLGTVFHFRRPALLS